MDAYTLPQEENALTSGELANLLGERELTIALRGRSTIEPADQVDLTVALAKKELEAHGIRRWRRWLIPRAVLNSFGNHIVMVRMANNRIARLAREKENLTAALAEATGGSQSGVAALCRDAPAPTAPGQAR
ncbi:MAG: hypothetical protein HY788_06815 [Deltaproteobacteria bacterium]|nr:hypothetical protein [Deltaproteobacteria bacterium]